MGYGLALIRARSFTADPTLQIKIKLIAAITHQCESIGVTIVDHLDLRDLKDKVKYEYVVAYNYLIL